MMHTNSSSGQDRSLSEWFRLLLDGWPALVVFVVLGAIAGIVLTSLEEDEYSGNSSVLVSPARGFLDPQEASDLPALADTVARLADTPAVVRRTANGYIAAAVTRAEAAQRRAQAQPKWIVDHVDTQREADSSIVQIESEAPTQDDADDLAAALASALKRSAEVGQRAVVGGTQDTGLRLVRFDVRSLGQTSPSPKRNIALGLLLGGLLGVVAAIAIGLHRRRVRTAVDVARELGTRLLGQVRQARSGAHAAGYLTDLDRDAIQATGDSLLITVTGTSDETRIAAVAELLARSMINKYGDPAVLVEGDSVRRSVSRLTRAPSAPEPAGVGSTFVDVSSPADASMRLSLVPAATEDVGMVDPDRLRRAVATRNGSGGVAVISAPSARVPDAVLPLIKASDFVVLVLDSATPAARLAPVRALGPALKLRLLGVVLVK